MTIEAPLAQLEKVGANRKRAWKTLLRDPQGLTTSIIVVVVVLLGVFAPLIAAHGPNESSLQSVNAPVGTPDFLLGGDSSGRDIFARLLFSINTSVISALIGASVAVIVGLVFGLVGGYFGPRIRGTVEWVFNLVMTFPGLLLLIVLMPITKGDFRVTMLIFGFLLSPGIYRIVRNLVLAVKAELYVDAARVSGLGSTRILARHVLPIIRGPVIIATAFLAGSAISVQAGLAFLGVGSLEVPSFGSMISDGFRNLYIQPLQFLWPSLLLGTLTASLVLFGNALRDALEGATQKVKKQPKPTVGAGVIAHSVDEFLVIEDLAIGYPKADGELVEVVREVSLSMKAGETLGVVGESGSGKTQTAFAVLGVLPRNAVITRGSIRFRGQELVGLDERSLRSLRGREIAYIPQEPMSNLDPSFTIGAQLVEGVRSTSGEDRKQARETVLGLLARVGIQDPERVFSAYPHQISGGMAQRVLIAGAVASRPALLIADEPTTALDVTVQADILDLLRDLQAELGMAVLIVTHNFGVVADICDRVSVMRYGRVIETGDALQLFREPKEQYTKELLDAILDEGVVRSDPPLAAATNGVGR